MLRRAMRKLIAALLFAPLPLLAQGAMDVKYQMPPKAIADVVDAAPTPASALSPDGKWLLLMQPPALLSIADLSQPELKLAGVRFNPETHDQTRSFYFTSLTLVPVAGGATREIDGIPATSRMRYPTWSPDSSKIAFTLSAPGGVELWVADAANGGARRISNVILNQSLTRRPFEWMPDSKSLLARAVPAQRGPAPQEQHTATGPAVQESRARKAANRTYEDMIRNESDAALFEYHMQSALVRVPLDGAVADIAPAAMILRATASPDGRFILVETAHRPFSYTVPVDRFPRRVEILSADGKLVRQIADLPLADNVPIDFDAVRTGPRDVQWRADKPATIFWAEALDGGNPRTEAAFRDRLFTLAEPFAGDAAKLMDVALRYDGITWGSDDLALVEAARFKDRKTQTWRIKPGRADAPLLVFDRSFEDRYSDPGQPVTSTNAGGKEVLHIAPDGRSIFLIGDGAAPDGVRPFVDRFDVEAKKATRIFRSDAPNYEYPVDVADARGDVLITRRESVTDPPNFFLRDLRKKIAPRAITSIPNPTPQLAGVSKEVIRYKRADGLELNGTLYLPPGYDAKKDGPLPVLMWAYPQEFKSAAAASQVTTSPYRFIRMGGGGAPSLFVLRGYAVLDNPTIPIIGEGTHEPNDTYVEQLVSGAQAAVDELVRRGVGDRDRMAISGHSYGAFMTANLLAHSDLFRAGIARSGAYNRTLTPFSFQAEERTYWQAPEVYTKMSPFTYANKINEPILLIHGMEDDNTGTFPIQSERLYAALSGLGGTTRLVMLPKEAHGYRARESVMHVLWEMDQWLEKYVKNAAKR
jgi:dipeptidyl aminopeptidase/acylaminoacyl peptidase